MGWGSVYHGYGGRYAMGSYRGFNIPYIEDQNTMGRGVKIPCIGGGGGLKIPRVRGLIYHG